MNKILMMSKTEVMDKIDVKMDIKMAIDIISYITKTVEYRELQRGEREAIQIKLQNLSTELYRKL